MIRLFILAALFAARHQCRHVAIEMTKRALTIANREHQRQCAGHLLCALNRVKQ